MRQPLDVHSAGMGLQEADLRRASHEHLHVEQPVHGAPHRDDQPTRHFLGPAHHEKVGLWGLWERRDG